MLPNGDIVTFGVDNDDYRRSHRSYACQHLCVHVAEAPSPRELFRQLFPTHHTGHYYNFDADHASGYGYLATSDNNRIWVLDLTHERVVEQLQVPLSFGNIHAFKVHVCGCRLVIVSDSLGIVEYRLDTREWRLCRWNHRLGISLFDAACTADGHYFILGSGSYCQVLRLDNWDPIACSPLVRWTDQPIMCHILVDAKERVWVGPYGDRIDKRDSRNSWLRCFHTCS